MRLPGTLLLALVLAASTAEGQDPGVSCSVPDSIAVRGNLRVAPALIRADAGIEPGDTVGYVAIRRAIQNIFSTAQFDSVEIECHAGARKTLVISVKERPVLNRIDVVGTDRISERQVRDRLTLVTGRPADPAEVTRARVSVDSLYRSRSYYLARTELDSALEAGGLTLTLRVYEGRRLAISGIQIDGNSHISDEEIVGAMRTKPEGFLWFRNGEFEDIVFDEDLSVILPALYARYGFIDMSVVNDSLIVDPELGKALIVITIDEGPQYRVGAFEIIGNNYFSAEELRGFYPFGRDDRSLTQRMLGALGGNDGPRDAFDQSRWEVASGQVSSLYRNEGFISADVQPVIERSRRADSTPVVNLRWEINEREQAIVNRIDIVGNNYTVESCIRQNITLLPGSVYNEERLIQSLQRIQSMGFFEDPTPPGIVPADDSLGLYNITLNLTEKRTGNLNFGASMGGGGAGVGGFIGFDQPNLFGRCKRGALNWQFGSLLNEFELTYSDPAIRKSNFSGTLNLYHLRSRYVVTDFGRQTRTGGYLRFGFPLFKSLSTRAFVSYGGEAVKYSRDQSSLLGQLSNECDNCFRSTVGGNITRDTRLGVPFPHAGVYQTVDAQLNGGPLGGTAEFQRYTMELRSYAPLGQAGGSRPGSQPIQFLMGLSLRSGFVFGNTGPFFPFQEFSMGGVQQGEALRGYDEFTITPAGYVGTGSALQARRESFGRTFLSTTAEVGARMSRSLYFSAFFDAGNVWAKPRDFNPTRMFRGAGIGFALVTPLGPLGLDYAYGFDKLDRFGLPDPGWKLHFKLGQFF